MFVQDGQLVFASLYSHHHPAPRRFKLHSLHTYIFVYADLQVRLAVYCALHTFPATCDTTASVEALG